MSIKTRRQSNTRQAPNFALIWLDASIDERRDKSSIKTISKLREVTQSVLIFINANECINYINNFNGEKIFMISSGALGQTTVPSVHDKPQIGTIYIFCGNKARHEQWAKQWSKVKGVFTDIDPICEALKQDVQKGDQDNKPINCLVTNANATNKNVDQLESSFIHTQILKEIILTIDFKQVQFMEFITYCRKEFKDNMMELKNIDKLEREYHQHTAIWWYTYPCFLHTMLNRALCAMNVDIIIKLGFFLRDLHNHIDQLHSEQYDRRHQLTPFTVYRGQGLSQAAFNDIIRTKGNLFSFNNFLSTHKDQQIPLNFARKTMSSVDLLGVLFVMKIDPSISSTPFANVTTVSQQFEEGEILFSMHSIFRIDDIKPIDGNNRLWQVNLSLISDNDPQFGALTDCIREEIFRNENGWCQLGELLIKMGKFDTAHQVCSALLDQTTDDHEKANIYYQLGYIKDYQGEYAQAIRYYEKSIEIKQKFIQPAHLDIAASYNAIGFVYKKTNEYSKALSYFVKVLDIYQKTLPPNHPDLATSYNNIGDVYEKMSDYSKALSYNEKSHEIKQKTLPSSHPNLATSYSDLGRLHDNMGNYSKALSYYESALDIGKRSLPENHPHLQTYKKNIESLKKKSK